MYINVLKTYTLDQVKTQPLFKPTKTYISHLNNLLRYYQALILPSLSFIFPFFLLQYITKLLNGKILVH